MKLRYWFLMPFIVIAFCMMASSPSQAQKNLAVIIKKVEPSTVVILTYDKDDKIFGHASGFFINKKGDIITNRHVLQGASRAEVKIAEGKIYSILRVVAEDKKGDLVQVSVDIPAEVVHPLSVSTFLPEVGERVIVIGSPLGLERTVSDGIVSAVRKIPEFGNVIQITAPLSSGSSGSPVVNMKGEVIGIATFIVMEGQNLNFAISGESIIRLTPAKEHALAEWEAGRAGEWLASSEELYFAGLVSLWVEDYEKALPYFEDAVKKNQSYAEVYFQIGYCNGKLGRYQKEIEAYKQAIRINPDYANAHNNLGTTYDNLGRYQEAIEAYKQAIRINPDYADAYYNLGIVYGKIGSYQEAIEAYKQAIRINPDYADAYYNLGVTYCNLGRYQEAIEDYKQAICINPDQANAYYNLGATYDNLGRYQEAIEAYKQAIRINPDQVEAHNNLGVAYGKLGRYQEGIEAFKQVIRINPDQAEAHNNLGVAYGKLGRYQEGIEAFKQVIRINPDQAEAHNNLGVAYGKLGRYQEALEANKQAIRVNPIYAEAHYNIGVVYLVLGDSGSALNEYRILKDLDRDLANKLFNLIYK